MDNPSAERVGKREIALARKPYGTQRQILAGRRLLSGEAKTLAEACKEYSPATLKTPGQNGLSIKRLTAIAAREDGLKRPESSLRKLARSVANLTSRMEEISEDEHLEPAAVAGLLKSSTDAAKVLADIEGRLGEGDDPAEASILRYELKLLQSRLAGVREASRLDAAQVQARVREILDELVHLRTASHVAESREV